MDQKTLQKIILNELKSQKSIIEEAKESLKELPLTLGPVERFNQVLKSMKTRDSFEIFLDNVSKHFDELTIHESLDDSEKGREIAMRIQKLTYKAHKQHLRVEKARRRLLEQILECLEQIERLSNKSGDSESDL